MKTYSIRFTPEAARLLSTLHPLPFLSLLLLRFLLCPFPCFLPFVFLHALRGEQSPPRLSRFQRDLRFSLQFV